MSDDRSARPAGDGDEPAPGRPAGRPGRLPPDPEAYDSERNASARSRGLAAPYIAGGRDPDPDSGRREERFYGRLLVAMVAVIVLGGFVLGVIGALIGGPGQ